MGKKPDIRDTQSLYTAIGDMSAKVDDLWQSKEEIFGRLRQNEEAIAVHKEFCDGVQQAKAVKEVADEKVQSRRKAIVDSVLIFVIVAALGGLAGACITVWNHAKAAPHEIVNPK